MVSNGHTMEMSALRREPLQETNGDKFIHGVITESGGGESVLGVPD